MAEADIIPLFESTAELPRGPHGLSRAEVAESQRGRLLSAITELVAERGYAKVTVAELVARAGVSRAAFYGQFADKEECLLAAYDMFVELVATEVTAAARPDRGWFGSLRSMLAAFLALLERHPAAARTFYVEIDAAGSTARTKRRAQSHAFAALLADQHARLRATDPSLGELPPAGYLAIALAIRGLVTDALLDIDDTSIQELREPIMVLLGALFGGAAGAERTVSAD